MGTRGGKERAGQVEGTTWKRKTILYVKQTASGNCLYDSRSSNQGSVTTQRGSTGWEVGERVRREQTYVHLWLIYVYVWQKPTQHCKAIIPQLKIDKLKC